MSYKDYIKQIESENILPLQIEATKNIIKMTKEALSKTPDDVALQMVLEQEELELKKLYDSGSDSFGSQQFKIKKPMSREEYEALQSKISEFSV